MPRFLGAERPCRLMVTSGLGIGVMRQKFGVIWAGLVQWREFCRLLEGYRQPLARPSQRAKLPHLVFCFSTPGRWQQVVQWHCHPWCLSYLSSVETPSGSRKDQNVMTADDVTRRCWGPCSPGTPDGHRWGKAISAESAWFRHLYLKRIWGRASFPRQSKQNSNSSPLSRSHG